MTKQAFRAVDIDGMEIFYREAGDPSKPTLLLLHGFPSSSHMFRDLIPLLADRFHIVAPDLPGFGRSGRPRHNTFDHLAEVIGRFTDVIGLNHYTLYVFDYGAPVGFRLALAQPGRVTGIISQNGNAYEEGLSQGWDPLRAYWRDPSAANREALRAMLSSEGIRFQYEHGVADPSSVSHDGSALDMFYTQQPGIDEIQLDLFRDYASNVALYPAFQAWFREHQPRFLAIWGKNDPFFLPPGAEAYRRDIPGATVRLLDTGHFALETHAGEIAAAIRAVFAD
jgi:pimeloyl-ACP methyl ester carboxylesterase